MRNETSRLAAAPRTKQIAAAVVGNALEWYDFVVYGFLTVIISRLFFPAESEYSSLLLTTATFGVGFFMRPVGGILLGLYADRQFAELAKGLTGFRLAYREERMLGGQPAIEIRFTWNGTSGPLDQRLLITALKRRVVLSFTATVPQSEAGRLTSVFDRVFSSIVLPEGKAGP